MSTIEEKYPLPCPKECGLEEPCVEHMHCGKWVAIDFCRVRDKRLVAKRVREKAELREQFLRDFEEWDYGQTR